MNPQQVVIVGGGIGGLAAALALARAGRRSTVVERAEKFGEVGAGIQLGPNAFRMFDALGIAQAVEPHVVHPEALTLMDAVTAEPVTALPLDDRFLARFGKPYGVVHRADLHAALLQACRDTGLVEEVVATRIVALAQDGSSATAIAEAGQRFRGACLVGADGLWSKVREWLHGPVAPIRSGHIAYRAVLPMAQVPPHLRTQAMRLWAGPKFHLVQYPLRGGDACNLVAVFHSQKYEEGWDAYGDPEELHARFAGACAPVQELLGLIEDWRMWVLCDREPIREWSRGRVTLLGDAAHPMLQYMAQGACMALEDAVCLAARLAGRPEAEWPSALHAYQEARYRRTARVQLTARLYGMAYHAEGVVRDLRNDVLTRRSVEQGYESLAWLYDASASAAYL